MKKASDDDWRRDTPPRRACSSFGLICGGVLFLSFVIAGFVSLAWTPYDFVQVEIERRFQTPSLAHWLGTDHLGRDILSMIMAGARLSIGVAVVAVGIGLVSGTSLGLAAAASGRGSLPDEIIMRCGDLAFAFPALLLAILITAVIGPGVINAVIAIGLFNIPVFARLSRAVALGVWERSFITVAMLAGKGRIRISLEHVLPNIMSLLLVQSASQFSLAILSEAALSYLGFGAQPPIPSWGRMLAEARTFIALAPHVAFVPGIAIMLTALSVNLMGNGLGDLFDPYARRRSR